MLNFFGRNALSSIFMKALKTTVQAKSGNKQHLKFHTKVKRGVNTKKMQRIWESLDNSGEDTGTADKQYKLLSYNILAQDLLVEHMHLYWDIEPQLLRWEHRMRRLKSEIEQLDPDILCLQEMQFNHLKGLVKQIKGCRKLEYVFKKKTGHRSDGCAIIYDKEKFQLLEERAVEYHTPNVATLNRENVAIMAKFNLRQEPEKHFIVATTHLLYNPKRQDVRTAQFKVLMRALTEFSSQYCISSSNNKKEQQMHLPIILTGDFNFEPKWLPETLAAGKLAAEKHCSKVEHNCLDMCPLDFGITDCASTFQDRWVTVDYILHSNGLEGEKKIKVWHVYKLPQVQELLKAGKIPSRLLGSDHLSLAISYSVI